MIDDRMLLVLPADNTHCEVLLLLVMAVVLQYVWPIGVVSMLMLDSLLVLMMMLMMMMLVVVKSFSSMIVRFIHIMD